MSKIFPKGFAKFRDSKTAAILIASAFVVVSITFGWMMHDAQNKYLDQALEVSSQNFETTIMKNTFNIIGFVGRMGERWKQNNGTDKSLWHADAQNYVKQIDGVDTIMWIDAQGILQWSVAVDPGLTLESGFDFTQHGMLGNKMKIAKESKRPEFTKVTKLSETTYAIHVLYPIWNQTKFDGFIGIKIDISRLLASVLIDSSGSGFVLKAQDEEGRQVYLGGGEFQIDGPQKTFDINMDADDDGWLFTVYPTTEVLALFQSPIPYLFSFAGSLIGLLFFATMSSRIKAKRNARLLKKEVNHRQRMESKIEHMAKHDALTHLPNRNYLNIYLENKVKECGLKGEKIALMFLNIDNFKQINDIYSHQLADEVLKVIPDRINQVLNQNAMIAHMGGDEFVVCLSENLIEERMFIYAEDLLKNVRKPIEINGEKIRITASIGVCFYPHHGHSANELIIKAEHAMDQAKNLGKDIYAIFDESLETSSVLKAEMIQSFNQGIDNNEFEMFFQPRHDIKSGAMLGSEALLRWKKDGKYLAPDTFLDVAEESGMIVNICNHAFDLAFKQYEQLFNGNPPIMLAINVSAKQLSHPDFLNDLFSMMEEHHFPSEMLEVELTEQTLIENYESSLATLNALSSAGVKVALDDFGTGYSSLSYLKNFPVNVLKIDKSFIKDIHQDKSDLELAKAIIAMGKSLNMEVVAEGVENNKQLKILANEGCHQAQGYLLNKPLPFGKFHDLFNETTSSADASA